MAIILKIIHNRVTFHYYFSVVLLNLTLIFEAGICSFDGCFHQEICNKAIVLSRLLNASLHYLVKYCARVKSKVEMYSKYERQKDNRSYGDRLQLFTGPQFVSPPERIKPQKVIRWNDEGLPTYADDEDTATTTTDQIIDDTSPAAVDSVA